jgi:hypothetical protein
MACNKVQVLCNTLWDTEERRYSSYSFLMTALDGGEWSASCSHFTPWIGGWVGLRAGLDMG